MPETITRDELHSLVTNGGAAIVVNCANTDCRNSYEAAADFEALGDSDVSVYSGGKEDWREAGFKLETD